jgi:hypothetical protein
MTGTPSPMLAPINNPRHTDFEESLTSSPIWHSAEQIAAQLASPTSSSSSSSETQWEFPLPPEPRVLLLSKVTLCTESGNPITPTDEEFPELPLALVLPPGNGRELFFYRPNELRLRMEIDDFQAFSWWFDDFDTSILVLKIYGTKVSADVVSGQREQDASNTEDWMFWEQFDWEARDSAVASLKKHYITIRAHSEDGSRAVGEFGRLLDQTRFGRQEGERTPAYEGYQGSVETRPQPTASAWKRPGSPMESLPKRSYIDSPPRRQRSRSLSSPRAGLWRPDRSPARRAPTRSRSPEKPRSRWDITPDMWRPDRSPDRWVPTESPTVHTREGGNRQPDKEIVEPSKTLPENRASAGPVMEVHRRKAWIDMTEQEKEKRREEIRAKGRRR